MKIFCTFLLSLFASTLFASDAILDSLLNVLGHTIENKEIYSAGKEVRIEELKQQLSAPNVSTEEKIWRAKDLCSEYNVYCTDSALRYSIMMGEYAKRENNREGFIDSEMFRARILRTMGLLKESSEVLDQIDTTALTPKLKTTYLISRQSVYNALRDFSVNTTDHIKYEERSRTFRELLLADSSLPSINRLYITTEQNIIDQKYDEALQSLLENYNRMNPDFREAGIIAHSIAIIYAAKGDRDKELEYFARSAISDLKNGVRDYLSLRKLASLMFEQGDIDRAYNYMKCALNDAIFCNARLRTLETSEMFLVIDKSFQKKEEERHQHIVGLLSLTACLMFLLFFAVIYIRKQNVKLSRAKDDLAVSNTSLKEMNKVLSDANIIKEESMTLYMEQYSNYLSKIDSYKQKAYRIAKSNNTEGLISYMESFLNPKEDLQEFYSNFDSTILRLFPNFVSQFNDLLADGEELKPKSQHELTPELRIFALIRLGIADSTKISYFLRYSVSTIYNYRTKMRNKAAGNRDEFEEKVRQIGRDN